jgi:hypothetical protein
LTSAAAWAARRSAVSPDAAADCVWRGENTGVRGRVVFFFWSVRLGRHLPSFFLSHLRQRPLVGLLPGGLEGRDLAVGLRPGLLEAVGLGCCGMGESREKEGRGLRTRTSVRKGTCCCRERRAGRGAWDNRAGRPATETPRGVPHAHGARGDVWRRGHGPPRPGRTLACRGIEKEKKNSRSPPPSCTFPGLGHDRLGFRFGGQQALDAVLAGGDLHYWRGEEERVRLRGCGLGNKIRSGEWGRASEQEKTRPPLSILAFFLLVHSKHPLRQPCRTVNSNVSGPGRRP